MSEDNRFEFTSIEFSVVENGEAKRSLVGYPVVWGAMSDPRGGKRYRFNKGSVSWNDPTFVYWNHNDNEPLAGTPDKSLRLSEDDKGIKAEMDLIDTEAGRDSYTKVKSGLVKGMSFAGRMLKTEEKDKGIIDVYGFAADDVTITHRPAMKEAEVIALMEQKQEEQKETQKEWTKQYLKLMKSKLDSYRITG